MHILSLMASTSAWPQSQLAYSTCPPRCLSRIYTIYAIGTSLQEYFHAREDAEIKKAASNRSSGIAVTQIVAVGGGGGGLE